MCVRVCACAVNIVFVNNTCILVCVHISVTLSIK